MPPTQHPGPAHVHSLSAPGFYFHHMLYVILVASKMNTILLLLIMSRFIFIKINKSNDANAESIIPKIWNLETAYWSLVG